MLLPRRLLARGVCLVLCTLGLRVPSALAVPCTTTSLRAVRTFYTGETPYLSLLTHSRSVNLRYVVRNFEGAVYAQGTINTRSDRPETLQLPGAPNGFYNALLTFPDGSTINEDLAVIPRPDADAADDGLFGFACPINDEDYQALAQAGVRTIRSDLDWPHTELTQGKYNSSEALGYLTTLQKYGLRMIPTLGYSPGWTRIPIDDYPDRGHTWPPDSVEDWDGYVRYLYSTVGTQTVSWPSRQIVPDDSLVQPQALPFVRAWEVWNEADQGFYSGPWGRYLDLLRVAHCAIKGAAPGQKVIYGGSCGHWTELGMTCAANALYYFDSLCLHAGGDITNCIPTWRYGAPQVLYRSRLPRPSAYTECYPSAPSGVSEPDGLVRMFASLKAYRETDYCMSEMGGLVEGSRGTNSISLLYRNAAGELRPNPKYVAYAVCRWLLSSATYLGPLYFNGASVSSPGGIVAYLFAWRGQPLLIAWADGGASISVTLGANACRYDSMGRSHPLSSGGASFSLSGGPTIVFGLADSYIPTALANYCDLVMAMEYGLPRPAGCSSPYCHSLGYDLTDSIRAGGSVTGLRQALQSVDPTNGATWDAPASYLLGLLRSECSGDIGRGTVMSNWGGMMLMRLQDVAEWYADVRDAVALPRGEGPTISADDVSGLMQRLGSAATVVHNWDKGTVRPHFESLVSRAQVLADRCSRTRGPGAFGAAANVATVVEQYGTRESTILRDIFAVAHFPTANQMLKGYLFHPGRTHTLYAQVYNYTNNDVTGTLSWSVPDAWLAPTGPLCFTAPAHGHTDRLPMQVTLPGLPTPWGLAWATTPQETFLVTIPATLSTSADLVLSGSLSDGTPLLSVDYPVDVGTWHP